MACNCSSNKQGVQTSKTWTLTLPNGGGTKSYQTEIEAKAAAQRLGGTVRAGS